MGLSKRERSNSKSLKRALTPKVKKSKKAKVPESGIEAFIERNNPKRTAFPNITDLALWKKKFKVDENIATRIPVCNITFTQVK